MSAKWTVHFGIIRQIEFPAIVAIPDIVKKGNTGNVTSKKRDPVPTNKPPQKIRDKIRDKELCSHVQTEEE